MCDLPHVFLGTKHSVYKPNLTLGPGGLCWVWETRGLYCAYMYSETGALEMVWVGG